MKLKQVTYTKVEDAAAANLLRQKHYKETLGLLRRDAAKSLVSDKIQVEQKIGEPAAKRTSSSPSPAQLENCKATILAGMATQSTKRVVGPPRVKELTAAEIEENKNLASSI